jgi:lipoprotein NlpI
MARLVGLQCFGELGDQAFIGLIIPLLRDPEPQVQSRAWSLLKTLSGKEIPKDQPDQWTRWWAENRLSLLIADHTQAIKMNATNGVEYRLRACLYNDAHDYPRALADFRQAIRWGSNDPDYPRFRVWLIRARTGEEAEATRELAAYLAARRTGRPEDWPSQVGHFLAGQLSEAGFLKAAKNRNARTNEEQHCEAWFYAGMKRLIAHDQTTAAVYFQNCLDTGVDNFEEYASAEAELKFLRTP